MSRKHPELNEEASAQVSRTGIHLTFGAAVTAIGVVIGLACAATWAWADIKHDVAAAQATAAEVKDTAANHTKQLQTLDWKVDRVMDKLGIYVDRGGPGSLAIIQGPPK